MGLGLLGITFQSQVLPYNDESTPVKLTGIKMLPILEIDQVAKNESLDILKSLDQKNILNWNTFDQNKNEIEGLINKLADPTHSLCMPYWIWTPEFDDESRKYFQSKKEIKRGPFKNLVHKSELYKTTLNDYLKNDLLPKLSPYYLSPTLTIADIIIASHLWGLYIVPEFQFDPIIHNYLQSVKNQTHFNYHEDFWV